MRQLKITKQVTNRDTPSLDKYLQEIGRVDLISPEEEVILARKIKTGDSEALEKTCQGQSSLCRFCCKTVPESGYGTS